MVEIEIQTRHGYAGDLAARDRWRRQYPRDHIKILDADTVRISVHVDAIHRDLAKLLARARVLEVFAPKHYSALTISVHESQRR